MTRKQRNEVIDAILFYEKRGWDWGSVVAFLCWKYEFRSECS